MLTLAIETSCDESALALLAQESSGRVTVLADEISSQVGLHKAYGGVVPELAAREHLRNLPILYDLLLEKSKVKAEEIEQICVTTGPGLKGCLLMGMCFAEGLALGLKRPLYNVNHIEAHVLAPMIENADLRPPYLALVVSGGHTEIVKVNAVGEYEILARTIDDAAGEAFDKSANLLGFEYPGGPQLARLADSVSESRFQLPKVMLESKDFSFSGLKTAISLLISKTHEAVQDQQLRAELSLAIQTAIIDTLMRKLRVAREASAVGQIAITGGVAANQQLRRSLSNSKWPVYFPSSRLCTDNAVIVGYAHLLRQQSGKALADVRQVRPRWPIEQITH